MIMVNIIKQQQQVLNNENNNLVLAAPDDVIHSFRQPWICTHLAPIAFVVILHCVVPMIAT